MKAIMYHYVREYDPDLPNFRFLDIANFRKQLDHFEAEHGFVTHEEWTRYSRDGDLPEQPGKVVLTFDDAMRCHYTHVFPELRRRNLWGIFYAPGKPYREADLLDVHKIHLLCGAFDGERLLAIADDMVTPEMVPDAKRKEFRERTYTRQINQAGVSEFKRLMNYFIDYETRSEILQRIAEKLGFGFESERFYVSLPELAEMRDAGMVIGSHSMSHPVMSKLTGPEQRAEIRDSFAVLSSVIAPAERTYCHPYGGFHSFDENTLGALAQMDVAYAFNVDPRDIEPDDWLASKFHLPRYDCNMFPHGKAS